MRVLVIGLGSMGRRRLRNLTHIGGHELAGMEPATSRAAEVGREFGIPVFNSLDDALGWDPHAVVISTPPDTHTQIALTAAKRRIHFFTEASVIDEDMSELIAATHETGIIAAPSATMRFHPAVTLMRERLASGTIGRPLVVTNHCGQYLPDWHPWEDYRSYYVSRRETGAAKEIVPFELNWLSYLLGPVTGFVGARGKVSDLEVDIDDVYAAAFVFKGRVFASMVVDVVSRPAIRHARIAGELGTLIWDWNERVVREWREETGVWQDFPDPPAIVGPGGDWVSENMYVEEMRAYLGAISGTARWPFSIQENQLLLELTSAIPELT